ncbi:MAG: hypothetical protein B7Y58_11950 [Halothiobacillus sp. 35-54-62]|nr:MAG: hypothetical protein B7Y58_11950 [Halothiobacillus sp. 35-54-62]
MGAFLLLGGCGGGGSAPMASAPTPAPVPSLPPPSSAANYVLTITGIGQAQSDSILFQANLAPPPTNQTSVSSRYVLKLDSTEASAISP